jgi:hypothetical protein
MQPYGDKQEGFYFSPFPDYVLAAAAQEVLSHGR